MNSLLDWHRKNNPYLYDTERWYWFMETLGAIHIVTGLQYDFILDNIIDELEPK